MCVLPFTKFLKKIDEEMKMKMRERSLAGGSFFKQCFLLPERKETKKKSLPRSLSKSKVDTIILQNLFFARKYIYRVVSTTQYN